MRTTITIYGIVQGVGFRPFVYRLATGMGLNGWVANTPAGVTIELDGKEELIHRFLTRLALEKPPASRIDRIERSDQHDQTTTQPIESRQKTAQKIQTTQNSNISYNENNSNNFKIKESSLSGPRTVLVSPDLDVCDNCLTELYAVNDRRFRYPFVNCTDCGPRYTIIDNLPYDRAQTAMAPFAMCDDCHKEYTDPASRRFHAEAICCPACGPRLWLVEPNGAVLDADPISHTIAALKNGAIVAIKGIGGFHLAVDASNKQAVQLLRTRKRRPDKPLAVMSADRQTLQTYAQIDEERWQWLCDRRKPIVLLPKKVGHGKEREIVIADEVAPDNRYIGVMLPYTPLHHLLLTDGGFTALVMTSANLSGEPIVTDNDEALAKLAAIADLFVMHDRRITTRLDDSVLRVEHGRTIYLRRARGFAPIPLPLADDLGHTLAVGASVKSTVCLTRGREAFVSQHIGDLDLFASEENFGRVIDHFTHLLEVCPDLVVHDLHPDYPSTRHAARFGLPTHAVQHHHAHAVSCMAEHGLTGPVLALCLDGSGYGPDGTIWGGEVLLAKADTFTRLAHLRQVPLPGGETAIREPWRMAASQLFDAFGDAFSSLPLECLSRHKNLLPGIRQMLMKKINSPLTSSCGRLFDAVAAMAGLRDTVSFEGQAAMALEMCCPTGSHALYPYEIHMGDNGLAEIDTRPLIRAVATDCGNGESAAAISGRFHHTVAHIFARTCDIFRQQTTIDTVVCSGGVLQNAVLTELLVQQLTTLGMIPLLHKRLPPNDGCIAFGQAVAGRILSTPTRS